MWSKGEVDAVVYNKYLKLEKSYNTIELEMMETYARLRSAQLYLVLVPGSCFPL